ncbi:MAG: sugar phosphate isomerase/epimerase [Clostridia bacterium]|nr:sugar phosphate isomerase/epimerase [Clostridia bacterium]
MKIGINQFCYPMSYDVGDAIEATARMGFDSIELCFTAGEGYSSGGGGGVTDALDISGYYNRLLNMDSKDSDFRALRRLADDAGLRVSSVGGIASFTIWPLTAKDPGIAKKSIEAVKKMLDAADILGADTVLVIPGMVTEDLEYLEAFEIAQERIALLADHAPHMGIGIENVWNNMLYSPLELNSFVDGTGRPNVGVYFDIANARRFGCPEAWIRCLGRRIRKFHCKDYRMSLDNINAFTNILDGDVNYPAVLDAIRGIGYDGDLVVELTPPAHYLVESTLAYARRTLLELLDMQKKEERK